MKRGFTMIELLIVVAIVGIIGAGVFLGAGRGCGSIMEADSAELKNQAHTYATNLGYTKVSGVSCMTRDSDGDGYVSCTLTYKDKAEEIQFLELQCAGGFNSWKVGEGCRIARPNLNRR